MSMNKIQLAALTFLVVGVVATVAGYTGQAQALQAGKPDASPIAAKPDEVETSAGRRPDVRGRPRARPERKTGARRNDRGSCAEPGDRACYPTWRRGPRSRSVTHARTARAGSGSMRSYVIVAPRGVRRHRPGARLWCRLGRARPRRRPAHRRYHAPTGASDPRATVRPARPARPRTSHSRSRRSVVTFRRLRPGFVAASMVSLIRWTKINDFPAWPKPVTTDAEGRFTLRGVGRDLDAVLTVHHPRFALQRIRGRDGWRFGIEANDRGAGAGPDPHRARDLCRHGQGGPSCPARVDGQPGEGRHPCRIRDRRRGTVPRESSASGPHPTASGPIPRKDSPTSSPRKRLEWPKGRSSSPSTSPYRAAS